MGDDYYWLICVSNLFGFYCSHQPISQASLATGAAFTEMKRSRAHWESTHTGGILLLSQYPKFNWKVKEMRVKWLVTVGIDGVARIVTASVHRRVRTLTMKWRTEKRNEGKGEEKKKGRLMDSPTCWGWNQLKWIKSRIHAFSKWQICAGNWERQRENNVFDLPETGCSFRQRSQNWSEMRSW